MANHKSALKRVAVTAKKNLNNRVITSRVKTAIKSFDKSLEAGDQAAITAAYVNAVSTVDKAAARIMPTARRLSLPSSWLRRLTN